MSQITQPRIAPLFIGSEAAALAGVATGVLAANAVYLYAFEVQATITVTGARWRIGTAATGTTDIGIYTFAGNFLIDTGAVSNATATNMSANFTANLVLSPGQYFAALCPSNSTDNYLAVQGTSSVAELTRFRLATNSGTSGVLPSTTGGYSGTLATKAPAFFISILNGLS